MGGEVYFEGSFGFRKPLSLIGGIVIFLIALGIGYGSISLLLEDDDWAGPVIGILVAAWNAYGAVYFIWSWVVDRKYPVRIDSAGVLDGRRFYPWRDIHRLALGNTRGDRHLVYNVRSATDRPNEIYVDHMPSADQCAQLIARIAADVGRQYPHVRFD